MAQGNQQIQFERYNNNNNMQFLYSAFPGRS